jgi:rhodanese-related sulfurtransferase
MDARRAAGYRAGMTIRSAQSMVEAALAEVQTLSVEEGRALLGRAEVQFVDIRDVRELEREGLVPGAFHAPRGLLEFWVDPTCEYHQPVFSRPGTRFVLYCAAGWRSALAAKTLQDMGLGNVAHLGGGFTAWKAAGAPVEARRRP